MKRASVTLCNAAPGAAWLVAALAYVLSGCSGLTGLPEFHRAAASGDVATVKGWIAAGKNVDATYDEPGTLEAPGTDGITALMLAAERRHLDVVRLLIDSGANLYLRSAQPRREWSARSAFDYAVKGGDPEIVRLLWERSDKKTFRARASENLATAVHRFCSREPNLAGQELIVFFLDNLVGVEQASPSLLGISDRPYCIDEIRFLLDRGVVPSPGAVVTAASLGESKIVALYVERGVDIDAVGNSPYEPTGATPLTAAAASARLATVELLLRSGAAPDAPDRFGRTALIAAANGGCLNVVHPDCEARQDVMKLLIKHGARPDVRDAHGKSAIDYVEQRAGDAYLDAMRAILNGSSVFAPQRPNR